MRPTGRCRAGCRSAGSRSPATALQLTSPTGRPMGTADVSPSSTASRPMGGSMTNPSCHCCTPRAPRSETALDTDTGRLLRGRIAPACRGVLRRWLADRFGERTDVEFAVEACTGWRFVVEELEHAGIVAHLAETADTSTARGRKQRAKTDAADAALVRGLLAEGRLPTSWIPPEQVREMRAILELYKDLRDGHTAWVQRIHAILFHQGVPQLGADVTSSAGRARLDAGEGLSPAGRQAVTVALRVMDCLQTELDGLHRQIRLF